ncbi:ATP-dependent DNA helicase [Trichonephila clavipes]|nr:ATP-dependent DNA helicase [Trichonephila clavipes]
MAIWPWNLQKAFDVDLHREQNYNISDHRSLILAKVRSKNDIALALASSEIATTLLPGGRTAYSALKLSLNIQTIATLTCSISKASGMLKVLQKRKVIVWDECTMIHKKLLEALDRSLQDLHKMFNHSGMH